MDSLLQQLLSLSHADIRVEQDPARLRPVDLPRIVCDCSKLQRETGWQPAIPIGDSLQDTLDYWRGRTARAS